MVFSSAVFLFVFLPLTFLTNRMLPGVRLKNAALILASLIFYAFGEPVYICIMLISVAVNYGLGLIAAKDGAAGKAGVWIAILFNLLMIGVFKYADFLVESLNALVGWFAGSGNTFFYIEPPGISLPIGISFFTFQAMSYVIDVYREKEICQRSFFKILLYISFFPQLVAGPIVKFRDIEKELESRNCTNEETAMGIRRFVVGLAKKLLIANTMGQTADLIFAMPHGEINLLTAWLGAIAYALQIYYDFSGYSDMAIGLGKMFGFHFKENFMYPYSAASIQEFWRRWHISLSSWFRDYLYIPLGGNRKGPTRTAVNKFIVFFATGLWHGASWTFVAWGLIHGFFAVLEQSRFFLLKKLGGKTGLAAGRIYAMLVVVTAFVLFRAETFEQGFFIIGQMYGGFHFDAEAMALFFRQMTPDLLAAMAAGILFSQPVGPKLKKRIQEWTYGESVLYMGSLLLLIFCLLNLSAATFNPFIYFRF